MLPALARNSLDHVAEYYHLNEDPQLVDELFEGDKSCLEKVCPFITIIQNYNRAGAEINYAENEVRLLNEQDREVRHLLTTHLGNLGHEIENERLGLYSALLAVASLVSFVSAIVFTSPVGATIGIATLVTSVVLLRLHHTGSAGNGVARETMRDLVNRLEPRIAQVVVEANNAEPLKALPSISEYCRQYFPNLENGLHRHPELFREWVTLEIAINRQLDDLKQKIYDNFYDMNAEPNVFVHWDGVYLFNRMKPKAERDKNAALLEEISKDAEQMVDDYNAAVKMPQSVVNREREIKEEERNRFGNSMINFSVSLTEIQHKLREINPLYNITPHNA